MRHGLLIAFGLVCGCWPDSSGIDPPGERFFFPTGLALAADGSVLLVANSNFDLHYNAGTVVAVRIHGGGPLGECCSGAGCAVRCVDEEIGACGRRCTDSRDEGGFLATAETVVVGSGVTDLTVSPDGTRAYVAVRGNGSLTWLDVDPAATAAGGLVSCAASPGARGCDDAHTILRTADRWVPAEPYSVLADDSWVVMGHVTSGNVSVFRASPDGPPTLERVVDSFPTGTNGLARHPATGWYYMVSRDSRNIYPFTVSTQDWRVGEGPAVTVGRTISIDVNYSGSDSRFMAFSPSGDRAYVTNRAPPSLVVVDTSVGADGTARGDVLDTIELGSGPSKVAIQPLEDGAYLVLAVCFDAQEVYVIDPELRAVVDVIRTGSGPHALVPDPVSHRAYLANFGESTVWVFDLEPSSPYFGDAVLKIGLPERPASND